ncbi:hypothetical protein BDV06DRAFT_212699 [Aspergillus oleicola]
MDATQDANVWEDIDGAAFLLPSPPKPRRLSLPRDPNIVARKLSRYLKKFDRHPSGPNVHHLPITFKDEQAKTNWLKSLPDGKKRETFSVWWHAPKFNKFTWLGCFSTWTGTWVADEDWDKRGWHVWGVAAIKMAKGKGKCLILYDCDPLFPDGHDENGNEPCTRIDARPRTFMLQMQVNLLWHIRRIEKVNVKYVFYNTCTRRSGQDRCLYNTMRWMRKLIEFGDEAFIEGFDEKGVSLDPRAKGCALVTRR